jgi:hypothetical protein
MELKTMSVLTANDETDDNRVIVPMIPKMAFQVQFIPEKLYQVGFWDDQWYLVKPGLVKDITRVKGLYDAFLYPCLKKNGDMAILPVTYNP